MLKVNRCFRETYGLHRQGRISQARYQCEVVKKQSSEDEGDRVE
jgi:hypothetical protein